MSGTLSTLHSILCTDQSLAPAQSQATSSAFLPSGRYTAIFHQGQRWASQHGNPVPQRRDDGHHRYGYRTKTRRSLSRCRFLRRYHFLYHRHSKTAWPACFKFLQRILVRSTGSGPKRQCIEINSQSASSPHGSSAEVQGAGNHPYLVKSRWIRRTT